MQKFLQLFQKNEIIFQLAEIFLFIKMTLLLSHTAQN
jgi:hypothetical protein